MDSEVVMVVWTPMSRCSVGFDLNLANKVLKVDSNVRVSLQFPQSSLPQTAGVKSSEDERTFVGMWPTYGFSLCRLKIWNSVMQNHEGGGATVTKWEVTSTDAPSMSNQYDSLMLTKPSQKGDKRLNTSRSRTNHLRNTRTSRLGGGKRWAGKMRLYNGDQHLYYFTSKGN